MQVIRSCLMALGLVFLFMITSCAVGVRGCVEMLDPTSFHQTVDEEPEKTRRMLRSFLQTAELEDAVARGVNGGATELDVADYSDGTLRLTLQGGGEQLLEIVARFTAEQGGKGTRVEIVSDGNKLAERIGPGVSGPDLHREIRDRMEGALHQIDKHQVMSTSFLLSRVVKAATDR